MQEMRWGAPFVGPSGHLIRTILNGCGFHVPTTTQVIEAQRTGREIDHGDIYFTNAAICTPPRSDAEAYKTSQAKKTAALLCYPRLEQELQPYLEQGIPICAVGGSSSLALVGDATITKIRGLWHEDNTVLTTWHPAYILRQPARVGELIRDIRKLKMGKPAYLDHVKPAVLLINTVEKMEQFTDCLLEMISNGDVLDNTVAYDIETDNIRFRIDRILCIQISWDIDSGAVITEEIVRTPEVRKCLRRLFDEASGIKWVGHNAKFDMKFLYYQLGIWNVRLDYDSLLGNYVLDENRMHGLKELLAEYYCLPDYEKVMILPYLRSKNDMYSKVPRLNLYEYGVMDTAYTLRLWRDIRVLLEKDGLFDKPFLFPVMACQPMYLEMELYGMKMNRDQLSHLSEELHGHLQDMIQQIKELGEAPDNFNPNSWKQVGAIMYDYFHMPLQRIRGLNPRSTAIPVRQQLERHYRENDMADCPAAKWLDLYDQWKSLEKIRSSYVDNLIPKIDKRDRVHPDILAYGTVSGRVSVRDPALQTIPRTGTGRAVGKEWGKEIKLCFDVPEGYKMVQVDYGQAEIRTAAWMAQDPFLLDCYRRGVDIHSEMAEAFFPGYYKMKTGDYMDTAIGPKSKKDCRKETKKCVFGRMYLGTEYTIAGTLNCSMSQARLYLKVLDKMLGGLVVFENEQWDLMRTRGYTETLTNRRRRCSLITNQNRDEARKAACNSPIQGTASDLTNVAALQVWEWLHDKSVDEVVVVHSPVGDKKFHITHELLEDVHILITVHDSIILEVPDPIVKPVAVKVKQIMERLGDEWMPGIPWVADIEVGGSWGSLKGVDYGSV